MTINSRVVVGTMTIEELMPIVQDVLHRVIRQDMTGLVRFVHSPQGPWFEIVYRDGVEIDLAQGVGKCNCSICWKTRHWGILVKPDALSLLEGADDLSDYINAYFDACP